MVGIIGAMQEEVDALREKLSKVRERTIGPTTLYEGELAGEAVVLIRSGIGKVNAAVSTTLLLEHYAIDYVINIGTAGGLMEEANVLDLVISTNVAHHDVDVTAFRYDFGQVPNLPTSYESDERLIEGLEPILNTHNFPFHKGLIVSGDQFIHDPKQRKDVLDHFPDAIAVEMEAASIAQVCHLYKVPFLVLRSLSDIAGKASDISFDAYVVEASERSSLFVEALVETIARTTR